MKQLDNYISEKLHISKNFKNDQIIYFIADWIKGSDGREKVGPREFYDTNDVIKFINKSNTLTDDDSVFISNNKEAFDKYWELRKKYIEDNDLSLAQFIKKTEEAGTHAMSIMNFKKKYDK